MRTLRVRDVMTKCVRTFRASASVAEAARAMAEGHISGAPVIDEGRIVGVLSRSDLVDPKLWAAQGDQATVDAVMTRVVFAVRPSDPVMSAVRLMVEEKIHRAIVVTEEGQVAGIVTPMDVMRALARGDRVQGGDYAVDPEVHGEPAVAVGYVDLRTFELRTSGEDLS
ncbi:MAG: CBS domain-containing protein [Polyangiaceae bacterium]|nr:CBS domain-containing protein [Polyangiaceae bacterium]